MENEYEIWVQHSKIPIIWYTYCIFVQFLRHSFVVFKDVPCRRLHVAGLCSNHMEARTNQLFSTLVRPLRWADENELATDHQKSSVISDTNHSQVRIEKRWVIWTTPLKSWGHAKHPLHFQPSFPWLGRAIICSRWSLDPITQCHESLNVMKALAGSSSGFSTEMLVGTYKLKCLSLIWTNLRWSERGSEDCNRLPSKDTGVPP